MVEAETAGEERRRRAGAVRAALRGAGIRGIAGFEESRRFRAPAALVERFSAADLAHSATAPTREAHPGAACEARLHTPERNVIRPR